ncbi:MAG: complex I NDUFA9 subunit family protein [Curvibacter sp.]|nr:complex I NDUFA9 subunit family protein [Curvibacter sp.]
MKVLLTGASGFIGRHVGAALVRAGHQVVPVSRRGGVDMAQRVCAAAWRPLLEGVDAVINAAGIVAESRAQTFLAVHRQGPEALFRACAMAGVRRVIQVSALGADGQAFSAFHLSKRGADEVLRGLPLDWLVLRPSLVHGPGGCSARLFWRMAAWPVVPVLGPGQQWIQPLHIDDLVDALMQGLGLPATRLTLDLVGPERLGFAEWLQRLRDAQGLGPIRLVQVPEPAALALARLAGVWSPLLRPDNLRMLQAGRTGDPRALEHLLGRRARALRGDLLDPGQPARGSRACPI